MPTYTARPTSQPLREGARVRDALGLLLEDTALRVRDGLRSRATLHMQEKHAAWMLAQELPAELLGGVAPLRFSELELVALTPPVLVAIVEWWHRSGGRNGQPLALVTVAKRKSTLQRALRVAVQRGALERLPTFPEIGLPPLRPRLNILRNMTEYRRLVDTLPVHRAEWVALATWSCQRPGDVERMTWSDVDLHGDPPSMIVRSTKTRKPHGLRVKCPLPLVSVLRARLARLEAAGTPPRGSDPLVERWDGAAKQLPLICVRLGLPPMRRTDLRHTGFSWMVRRTGLTRAAQEWGGWSDFNMLSRFYAHALPAQLHQAADELASMALEGTSANDNGDRTPPAPPAAHLGRNDNGQGG